MHTAFGRYPAGHPPPASPASGHAVRTLPPGAVRRRPEHTAQDGLRQRLKGSAGRRPRHGRRGRLRRHPEWSEAWHLVSCTMVLCRCGRMASLSRMPCESRRANEENTSTTVQTACASRQRVWQRRLRGADCKRECKGSRGETRCRYAHVADETTPRVVGIVESAYLLAITGRGNRRWDGGQLEMTQKARHDRLLSDGGNDTE